MAEGQQAVTTKKGFGPLGILNNSRGLGMMGANAQLWCWETIHQDMACLQQSGRLMNQVH